MEKHIGGCLKRIIKPRESTVVVRSILHARVTYLVKA